MARWSSRAVPTARVGSARRRRTASAGSQSGPRTSGPRWPTTSSSLAVGSSSQMARRKPTATHGSVRSTARTWKSGPRQRSPGRYRCQAPSILKWVCRVVPASVRNSRCLPRAATSRTAWPLRSAVANRGTRKSVATRRWPARAACMRVAARKTVSPSGIGFLTPVHWGTTLAVPQTPPVHWGTTLAVPQTPPVHWGATLAVPQPPPVHWGTTLAVPQTPPEAEAAGGGAEPGLGEGPGQRGVEHGLAVGLLDRQPAEGAVAGGQGEGVSRPGQPVRVVGEGEQGPAAPLHVQDQVAVDQDHHRSGLAPGSVAGPLTSAAGGRPVGPGQGGPI